MHFNVADQVWLYAPAIIDKLGAVNYCIHLLGVANKTLVVHLNIALPPKNHLQSTPHSIHLQKSAF